MISAFRHMKKLLGSICLFNDEILIENHQLIANN